MDANPPIQRVLVDAGSVRRVVPKLPNALAPFGEPGYCIANRRQVYFRTD